MTPAEHPISPGMGRADAPFGAIRSLTSQSRSARAFCVLIAEIGQRPVRRASASLAGAPRSVWPLQGPAWPEGLTSDRSTSLPSV